MTEQSVRGCQKGSSQSYLVKVNSELLLRVMGLFWTQSTKRSEITEIYTVISRIFYSTDALGNGKVTAKS